MPLIRSRREFLSFLGTAGASGVLPALPASAETDVLETKTVRLAQNPATCLAPIYACEELLRAEGFTDIRYVRTIAGPQTYKDLATGKIDFAATFPLPQIKAIEAGLPITIIGGMHVGCFELFANGDIRSVVDLKGKTVGLQASPPAMLALMAAQVGLDPKKDIRWVTDRKSKPLELFVKGKIDAFLGFPPEPQELHARQAGHVILSTTTARPWSQYFCCMTAANSEYLRAHPVATKRVLRALLKATDLCVTAPAEVARRLVDGGFTPNYDYALRTMKDVPYTKWRDYDAEDTIRFYALRLHDTGRLKATPKAIIANGTDWRFFNDLKQELKA